MQILDKNFLPENPLRKILNRNCVKMSYRCTATNTRELMHPQEQQASLGARTQYLP